MTTDLIATLKRLRSDSKLSPPRAPSPPPDYLSPFLPPQQSATAPLSLSASLLFTPTPSHLLTSSYLQQRQRHYSPSAWSSLLSSLSSTSTLYIGNLAFTTREETVYTVFSLAGPIQSLYMGLNSLTHSPCGFCFVRYRDRHSARVARTVLSGMRMDGRVVGVDYDQEFREGRQWGRGKTGGQIRDDHRAGYDEGRGGWGTKERLKQQMKKMEEEQVTQFKQMKDEERGGEREEVVEKKREKSSYAHAMAIRKAGAAAANPSVKKEETVKGREEDGEEQTRKRRRVEGEQEESKEADVEHDDETMKDEAEQHPHIKQEVDKETHIKSEATEEEAHPWSTDGDEQGMDEDRGVEDRGGGEGWTAEGGEGGIEGDGNEGEGFQRRDEAQDEGEDEEEVEHGFAAVDDETADPEWS